jgi:hypothetical protein
LFSILERTVLGERSRWGDYISDYKMKVANKRTSKNRARPPPLKRYRKRPNLAQNLDEARKFAKRTLRLPTSESEETDDTPPPIGIDDKDEGFDFDEAGEVDPGTGLNTLESVEQAAHGISFTLTSDIVDKWMDRLEEIGPTPPVDSRK